MNRASPHFAWREFDCRNGVELPEFAHGQVAELAGDFLEPLRGRFGAVRVLSGYRTRAYNQLVGGAPQSFHVYQRGRHGVAADVVCARGTAAAWYEWLQRLNPGGLGRYEDHVHVDTRRGHARW